MIADTKRPFYEALYLKCNQATQNLALWLRFALMNFGKARRADVWAVFFPPDNTGVVSVKKKLSGEFLYRSPVGEDLLDWQGIYLSEGASRGDIVQGAHHMGWDLKFFPQDSFNFHYAPVCLQKFISSRAGTPQTSLKFFGTITVNNQVFTISEACGSQGHYTGKKYPLSWSWAHCNSFHNTNAAVVFEIIDVRLSPFLPALKSCYIHYRGQHHVINGLCPLLFSHSHHTETAWTFVAKHQGLEFTMVIERREAPVAKVIYEDVDHSELTCHNAKQAWSQLTVSCRGKVVDEFISRGTTAFETVTRE